MPRMICHPDAERTEAEGPAFVLFHAPKQQVLRSVQDDKNFLSDVFSVALSARSGSTFPQRDGGRYGSSSLSVIQNSQQADYERYHRSHVEASAQYSPLPLEGLCSCRQATQGCSAPVCAGGYRRTAALDPSHVWLPRGLPRGQDCPHPPG